MTRRAAILISLSFAILVQCLNAQTTAFNYQGRLTDAGNPANGSFQMQFKLFDSLGGPTQIGSTISDTPVTVSQGVFSVKLDFGSNALSGANRWLEISVRHNSGESYTTLTPREQIASSPYAVRTLSAASADTATNATTATNALNLGGVAANQFVQTNDPRLSDSRNPLPNSAAYIQNNTLQQSASNFNISGNGTMSTLNVNGAFSAGGVTAPLTAPLGQGRIYFDSSANKFKVSQSGGSYVDLVGSGGVSGSGSTNSLPLWSAGTTLGSSSISQSGTNIVVGTGTPAHRLAVVGGPCWTGDCWGGALELENASAIGWRQNSAGVKFGIGRTESGLFFFRTNSPLGTTTNGPTYDLKMDNLGNVGIGNIGIGTDLTGSKLTVFAPSPGYGFVHTDGVVSLGSYISASAGWLGTRSNHPLHFFTNDGLPKMTISTFGNVGIGTTPTGFFKLNVETADPVEGGIRGSSLNGSGVYGVSNAGPGVYGYSASYYAGFFEGPVKVGLPTNGLYQVCWTLSDQNNYFVLAQCSSSFRYKKEIKHFSDGLGFINKLHPLSFRWKSTDEHDVGFGAEDVAKIDRRFVTYNDKGEVEGVKYDRLSVVFVNAIREQQAQIERLQRQVSVLRRTLRSRSTGTRPRKVKKI